MQAVKIYAVRAPTPALYGYTRDLRPTWLLEEIGAPYEIEYRSPGPELQSPEFLALSPFGRLPAMRDGDLTLFESVAICVYLAEKHGRFVPPPRTPERARHDQWLFAGLTNFEASSARVFGCDVFSEPGPATDVRRQDNLTLLEAFLPTVNSILANRDYLAGSEFQLCDLIFTTNLRFLAAKGYLANYPALLAYVERNTSRPAFRRADAKNGGALMGLALVTGASAGLGLEFARLFAADGHSLVLVARRREALEQIARELEAKHPGPKVHVIAADLSRPGAGAELFRQLETLRLPPVDFLVNNAGFGTTGYFVRQPLVKELELLDLNIRALAELTGLLLPSMVHRGRGRILNVGSTAGFQPGPFMATYYASKAFVNSFSEALQEELRGSGVSCTLLAPGATRTEFAHTAGLEKSRLFRAGAARADRVARAGYRGLMKGRTTVVPGLRNRLLIQLQRISPRALVRKIAGFLNRG